ncbi:DNA-binding winged helix-turn-helix (wHTH) protein [Rhizomicrobium palustre]|uniref:DNA-binding winged helix-turn-helix (WHTH) protein n=1 Tax=Rhizomicrobium palustre TaxID=189966 RepID=A0A846N110_9PROT|nr:winged helix-turn-helix domain-containing protein [Rhizomicrobium palustre]NIK88847.1 DNA-binding winged helix-turn-helix (wHTH) protein [Rhizomicrobium palustre]
MRAALDQIVLVQENDFQLGGLKVCPSKRLVLAGGARELLQPRIMQVLVALARRRGEVVSRDELMATCWGGFAVSDDAIHRCIARIRRLSESHGGFTLETVPRIGYQLICDAPANQDEMRAEVECPADSACAEPALPESLFPQTPFNSWKESRAVFAMAGFAAGALLTAVGFIGARLL